MGQSFELREMRQDDLPRVMEIDRECFPIPWHESAYLTEVSNRSAYYVVLCQDDEVAGYAGMWTIMDEAHITTLGVSTPYRRRRGGERLLIALLVEAIGKGARRATLEVRQSNTAAQNLYKKYGFYPVAVRRAYYSDNNENAIIMWVEDISTNAYIAKLETLKQKLYTKTMESAK